MRERVERTVERRRRGPLRGLRSRPFLRAVVGLGAAGVLATTPAALWASSSVTEIRLGASEGHYVIDILATEAFKYAQVESGAEPFVLTFFLLDTTLAFPAVTREVNEGPLRQVVAALVQREESRLARLDFAFERLIPFRVLQEDARLTIHLREPGVATRVIFRGSVPSSGEPGKPLEMPRAANAPGATAPSGPALSPPGPANPPGEPPRATMPAGPRAAPTGAASPSSPSPNAAVTGSPPPTPRTSSSPPSPPSAILATGTPGSASVSAPPRAGTATRVLRLARVPVAPDTQVRVHADGRLSYRTFTLTSPTRVVVDFEGVAFKVTESSLALDSALVERVRAARFRSAPTEVVRVVFDLRQPAAYWVEPVDDGVVVHIGSQGPAR